MSECGSGRGMSGEWPICNYFLLNQLKVAALQGSALLWIETTCGAGWLEEGTISAGTTRRAQHLFPTYFQKLFDFMEHLMIEQSLGFRDYCYLWF